MRSPIMKNEHEPVNSWEQLSLVRPAVVTLSLQVGVMVDSDHVQAQITVHDAVAHQLIAMQSWPSMSLHDVDERFREVGREFTRLLLEACSPFTR